MSRIESLINEVRSLPVADQTRLIHVLSACISGHPSARSQHDFWAGRSLQDHLNEQTVQPITDLAELKVDFWQENETAEAFLSYTRTERGEALSGGP